MSASHGGHGESRARHGGRRDAPTGTVDRVFLVFWCVLAAVISVVYDVVTYDKRLDTTTTTNEKR